MNNLLSLTGKVDLLFSDAQQATWRQHVTVYGAAGMKTRRFEKVQASFPFEYNSFTKWKNASRPPSFQPQLRLDFRLFSSTQGKQSDAECAVLLPVSDRLTKSHGLVMTSARSVCEDVYIFSIQIKRSPELMLNNSYHKNTTTSSWRTIWYICMNLPHKFPNTFVFILDWINTQRALGFANWLLLLSSVAFSSPVLLKGPHTFTWLGRRIITHPRSLQDEARWCHLYFVSIYICDAKIQISHSRFMLRSDKLMKWNNKSFQNALSTVI